MGNGTEVTLDGQTDSRTFWNGSMNERVKQIMLDHGLHKHITADCQHRMEMLAQLIVQECIRLCDQVDLAGADDCIDKIKDHFAVD